MKQPITGRKRSRRTVLSSTLTPTMSSMACVWPGHSDWRPQYPDAQATLQILQKLPPPFSTDPRIDLEESMIGEASGDVNAAQRAAVSAEQKGRERGSSLLVARAKLVMPVSTLPAFVAQQEEARHICERLGDMDCVGTSLVTHRSLAADQSFVTGRHRTSPRHLQAGRRSAPSGGSTKCVEQFLPGQKRVS